MAVATALGGCHCGAVRFAAELDLAAPVNDCNCTFCVRRGALMIVLAPAQLRLVAGEEILAELAATDASRRYSFCRRCGVHVLAHGHAASVGGDYVALNVRCIDGVDVSALKVAYWDGRRDNWDAGPRSTPWPVTVADS
jgi:hypothetical protein